MMIGNIIKLGWKNVWRNPMRSGVVITAVLLGTWAGIFLSGLFTGMVQGFLDNQFELTVGHIEIKHPQFEDLNSPEYFIPGSEEKLAGLTQLPYVEEASAKSLTVGLAQSARSNYGVTISGIVEDSTHEIKAYLQEGTMSYESSRRNPVVIGKKLAERLDVEMDSRMVLTFQDTTGQITGGAFRVAGLFDTFSDPFDEGNVFVNRSDLNRLLGLDNQIHTIKLTLHDYTQADTHVDQLQQQYPGLQIKSWRELSPELRLMFDMMDLMMYIVMIIIIIALVFSIINTMLMAVLERTRELGMLRAVGMSKPRIFSMIVFETLFLTMVGTPIGLFLSWLTVSYFGGSGIHLDAFADGLSAYGYGTIIYPSLPSVYYLNITGLIALAALLSAIYPAWKSVQLNPVEALRKFN